uniref:Uncharacterized protein n=1 Tax=Rhizophora mucronata TaxID=61149 RepID=A0A2P2MCX3_RHIMU
MDIRLPQVIGSASINQQFFPVQQNLYARPLEAIPPSTVSHSQQVPASQGMPKGGNMAAPHPLTSNISTDWLAGSTSDPTAQTANQGISPPTVQDGFAMTASGLTPSVETRPQTTTGQVTFAGLKPQVTAVVLNQPATKDSKQVGTSENGFASDLLCGSTSTFS